MEIRRDKSFQCALCDRSEDAKKGFGCDEIREKAIIPITHYEHRIDFYTCPGNFYTQSVCELLFIKEQFDKGVMPYGGALMEQPAKFIETMRLIDATQIRIEEEIRKKPVIRGKRGK